MNLKLDKELQKVYELYLQARANQSINHLFKANVIKNPTFFDFKSLQQHLNNPLLQPDWAQVVIKGKKIDLNKAVLFKTAQHRKLQFMDKQLLQQALEQGASVVLEGMDILEPKINTFLAKIDQSLPCALTGCACFFSQKGNEAYGGHFDTDDVLAVQLSGKKKWRIYEKQQRRYVGSDNLNEQQMGRLVEEVVMNPGDVIFARAGVPHKVETVADHSLHLAFELIDRTPNAEVIMQEVCNDYNKGCEEVYGPITGISDALANLLTTEEFRKKCEQATSQKRNDAIAFRERIGNASTINYFKKFH